MFGYGSYDWRSTRSPSQLAGRAYVCGDRFTAADVYVGSQVLWGTQFGTCSSRAGVHRIMPRGCLSARPISAPRTIDGKLIAEMQANA